MVFACLAASTTVLSQNPEYHIVTTYQSSVNFSLTDIFSFSVNNLSGQVTNCKLEIKMEESRTHLPIILLLNNNLKLEKGSNNFSSSDFSDSYFSNDLSSSFRMGQPFQSGNFEICITLTLQQNVEGPINECTELNLSDEFFIHLLQPDDREEIETVNPLLQWYSSSNDPSITYRLILAPLDPLRHPEDAIARHLKFIELDINDNQFLYPLNAPELEYGKHYAWQVIALKGTDVLGLSEAWSFTPVHYDLQKDDPKDCYRIVTKNQNNGNYLYGNVMKFAYENRTRESHLNYTVKDLTTDQLIDQPPIIELKPGLNKIDLQLKLLNGLKEGHQYLIRIRNKDNEVCQLTFNAYAKSKMKQ